MSVLACPRCGAAVLTTAGVDATVSRCWCSSASCGWRDTMPTAAVALSALLAAGLTEPEPATEPACLADG